MAPRETIVDAQSTTILFAVFLSVVNALATGWSYLISGPNNIKIFAVAAIIYIMTNVIVYWQHRTLRNYLQASAIWLIIVILLLTLHYWGSQTYQFSGRYTAASCFFWIIIHGATMKYQLSAIVTEEKGS
jgi:hypothetical protein